jgi:putative transposase
MPKTWRVDKAAKAKRGRRINDISKRWSRMGSWEADRELGYAVCKVLVKRGKLWGTNHWGFFRKEEDFLQKDFESGQGRRTKKKKRFSEEQIIGILREHEAGAKAGDLARKHGISEATLYNWKAKFGGMDVSDARKLRALEEENSKLKKLLADTMLDASALRELLAKKW